MSHQALKRVRKPAIRNSDRGLSPVVSDVFARYPKPLRAKLLFLRSLIFETAASTPHVGKVDETLQWNEPAYLTAESKSGSTIRINRVPGGVSRYAMYFNCKTNLADSFRTLLPKSFRYQGNRAIEFEVDDIIKVEELKLCISMALTDRRQIRVRT